MGPRPRNRARTHRFSALTFPNPASPRAVVDPTHVQTRNGQCRPYPPVFTSRRVSRPPVSARVCPRPSPTAGSLPPHLETIFLPPFTPVTRFSRSKRDRTRVCGYTFFFFSRVSARGRERDRRRARAHTRRRPRPRPRSSRPARGRSIAPSLGSDRVSSTAEDRTRPAPSRIVPTTGRSIRAFIPRPFI